jgi:hypothetical protein
MAAYVILLAAACSSVSDPSTPSPPVTPTATATLEASEPEWLESCAGEKGAIIVHCGPELRRVTIEVWACEGDACWGVDDPPCHRPVKLASSVKLGNFDEYSGDGERFECAVQFDRVPVGQYTVMIGGRAACGPACDALHLCIIKASANHIAIRTLGFEDCPAHVIS